MAIFGVTVPIQVLSHADTGQAISNSFHLSRAGGSPPSLADLTQLAADWVAYFSTTWRACLSTAFTWDSVIAKQVVDPTTVDSPLEATNAVNLAGTRAGVTHGGPASICALISIKSPVASRRARAHVFGPPSYNTADLNGDNYATAGSYWIAMAAYVAKLATGCSPTATWTGTGLSGWYLAQYSRAAALAGQPHVFASTAVVLQPKVRWLRSRERGTT